VSKWGLFVELKGNKCEGLVRYENLPGDDYYLDDENFRVIGQDTGRVIQLGDEVRVRVKSVDLFKHKMDFEMLADWPTPKKRQKQRGW
jgi:ribonuclease R